MDVSPNSWAGPFARSMILLRAKRTAIVDAHDHRAAVLFVNHLELRAKGQRTMGRRHGAWIETLSAGGAPPVKSRPVPGSGPLLQSGGSGDLVL